MLDLQRDALIADGVKPSHLYKDRFEILRLCGLLCLVLLMLLARSRL